MGDQLPPLARMRKRRRWQWRERIALALLVLPAPLALLLQFPFFEVFALIVLSVGAAGAIVILRGDWRLVGPHAWFDLVRLARRGRSSVVRVCYLLAMLGGLGIVYWNFQGDFFRAFFDFRVTVTRNNLARMSEMYSAAVIIVQNLAVLLLTPAYLATALTEEGEKRTLELLRTTHLHDREIVFGKLIAGLAHLAGVLLAGLPVLALAQLLGGVDMVTLLANFAITAMYLWTAGCVCIMSSAVAKSSLESVFGSYAMLAMLGGSCTCLTAVLGGRFPLVLSPQDFDGNYWHLLHALWDLLLAHAVFSGFCLIIAFGAVRPFVDRVSPLKLPVMPRELIEKNRLAEEAEKQNGPGKYEPIRGDALLWKEWSGFWWHNRRRFAFFWMLVPFLVCYYLVYFSLAFAVARYVFHDKGPIEDYDGQIRGWGLIVCWTAWLGLAYRTAASVARERQSKTLDGLLTLPVDRNDILTAKLVGAVMHATPWSLLAVSLLLFGILWSQGNFTYLLLFTLIFVAFTLFVANLGLYFSVTSQTVLQAQTKTVLTLFVLCVIGLGDYWFDEYLGARRHLEYLDIFNAIVNPFTFNFRLFMAEGLHDDRGVVGLTLLTFAVASYLLRFLARRAFSADKSEKLNG